MATQAAHILIEGPGHSGTALELREGITALGRLPSNDVILHGDLVSRHHARILFFDGRASIQDLGSHNGTWVNGDRVATQPLAPGDDVRVGNFKITFSFGEVPAARAETEDDRDAIVLTPFRGETIAPTMTPRDASLPAKDSLPPDVDTRDPASSHVIEQLSRLDNASPADTPTRLMMIRLRIAEAAAASDTVSDFVGKVLGIVLADHESAIAAFYRVLPGEAVPMLIAADGPGVQAGSSIPMSKGVLRWSVAKNYTVFSQDVAKDVRFQTGQSVMDIGEEARALVCAPVSRDNRVLGVLYVSRSIAAPFNHDAVDVIEAVAHLCAPTFDRLEQRRRDREVVSAREALSRFHGPDVVEQLLARSGTGERPLLEGRTCTVCCADIQGFTALAERLPAEQVTELLAAHYEQMCGIVFAHGGTVLGQMGDGIVAVFGAPTSAGNDGERTISAALAMRVAFDKLVANRPEIGPRRLRFGVNTGWTLSGPIGTGARTQYKLIGEPVDLARKIQAMAAPGALVISAETEMLVREHFRIQTIGIQQIRGRREPIELFEVIGQV